MTPTASTESRPWTAPCSIRQSHLGELFTILQRRLAGRTAGYRGCNMIALRLSCYSAQSISGVLVDPFDGRRYELKLRPLAD